jgi:hypothetical protein
MTLGPLEILVVAFPTTEPGAEVAQALAAAQTAGDVRVIDLLIITKSAGGELDFADLADLEGIEDAAADLLAMEMLGLLADEDIAEVAQLLDPGTSAVAVLVEHTWARGLADAVAASGGELVGAARIPHHQVEEAELALEQSDGAPA